MQAAKARTPAVLIALALVLAIAVAEPAVATIPAADLGLVDLEDVPMSLATSSPLLPPADLPISLPPPAHGPPLTGLDSAPNVHLRVALAVAFARVHACGEAENRIRGSRAVGSEQHQRNQWFRPGIAPGVCDGPSMYQAFGSSPMNYGDPMGLCSECGMIYRWWQFFRTGEIPADVKEDLTSFGRAAGKEVAATAAEELSPAGWANGFSSVVFGYDFLRQEEVHGWGARGLAAIAVIPGIPGLIRQGEEVVGPLRNASGKLDDVTHAARSGRTQPHYPMPARADDVAPSSFPEIDPSWQNRAFLPRGLEISGHAYERIAKRARLTLDNVDEVVRTQQSFSYFHEGVWKTGYYDRVNQLFVGTVDDIVTTVVDNAPPGYVERLLERRP